MFSWLGRTWHDMSAISAPNNDGVDQTTKGRCWAQLGMIVPAINAQMTQWTTIEDGFGFFWLGRTLHDTADSSEINTHMTDRVDRTTKVGVFLAEQKSARQLREKNAQMTDRLDRTTKIGVFLAELLHDISAINAQMICQR